MHPTITLTTTEHIADIVKYDPELFGDSFLSDDVEDDWYYILVDGDLTIEGDLYLDYQWFSPYYIDIFWFTNQKKWLPHALGVDCSLPDIRQRIMGIIVNGNLRVTGSITNHNSDYGVDLFVVNELYARNLVAGGANIVVKQNAYIEELCYSHYNHGKLFVGNTLHAKLIVVSDHNTEAKHYQAELEIETSIEELCHIMDRDDGYYQQYKDQLATLVDYNKCASVKTPDDLVELLMMQDSILKDSPYLKHPDPSLTEEDYRQNLQAILDSNSQALKHGFCLKAIPEALRSRAICELAVAINFHNLLSVPQGILTDDFYDTVIQRNTIAFIKLFIEYLKPESLTLPRLIHFLDLGLNPDQLYRAIPRKQRTREVINHFLPLGVVELRSLNEELIYDFDLIIAIITQRPNDLRDLDYGLTEQLLIRGDSNPLNFNQFEKIYLGLDKADYFDELVNRTLTEDPKAMTNIPKDKQAKYRH